ARLAIPMTSHSVVARRSRHLARRRHVARPARGKRSSTRITAGCAERHAILVDVGIAVTNYIGVGRAHDDDTAAISWDRWVGALIEQDRVVLDVTIVAEPKVTDAAAVTGAQVPADPVVVELVVVGAGAEADTACPRRRG